MDIKWRDCEMCAGTGARCPICNVSAMACEYLRHERVTCSNCHGRGKVESRPLPRKGSR